MIAFLHTSPIHIERFDCILDEIDSSIKRKHYVEEDLLNFALKNQFIDEAGFSEIISKIHTESELQLIICTCSTYGELCHLSPKTVRIDQAICEHLVNNYDEIMLAYTAKSTRDSSKKLILDISNRLNKQIKIKEVDCSSAWKYFENDNQEKYFETICTLITQCRIKDIPVFLAQASMEGTIPLLQKNNIEAFSSPKYGVQKLMRDFNIKV